MPILRDTRLEAFAQALARDADPVTAALEAGYAKHGTRARRRAARPHVQARVQELIRRRAGGGSRDVGPLIDVLMRAADDAAKLGSAAGFAALRALIAEVAKLKGDLLRSGEVETEPRFTLPRLTDEEWIAAFAPKNGD